MRITLIAILLLLSGCAGAGFMAQGALRSMGQQPTPLYANAPAQRFSCSSFTDSTGFTVTNCNP